MAIVVNGSRLFATLGEFRNYVRVTPLGEYHDVFVHHTASPEAAWRGRETLSSTLRYYVSLGWDACPHLFVAPEGVYLTYPLSLDGVGVAGHNYRTRHIETVGNYMDRVPSGKTLEYVVGATGILLQKPTPLGVGHVQQHRWFNPTACPGNTWSARWPWFLDLVARYMQQYPLGDSPTAEIEQTIELLRAAAFGALDTWTGVGYNPGAALLIYARTSSLGAPCTPELDVPCGGATYRLQGFKGGIVYARVGQWDRINCIRW